MAINFFLKINNGGLKIMKINCFSKTFTLISTSIIFPTPDARRGRTDMDVRVLVSCAPGAPALMTVMVPAAVGQYWWPPGRTPVPHNAALLGSVVSGLCLHGTCRVETLPPD